MTDIQKIADMMSNDDDDEFEQDYEEAVEWSKEEIMDKIELNNPHNHPIAYWMKWIAWGAEEAKKRYRSDAVDDAAQELKGWVVGVIENLPSRPTMGEVRNLDQEQYDADNPPLDDVHMKEQ